MTYVAKAYTFASTIGAIMQYCLRNQENPAYLCLSVIIIITSFLHNSCGNRHWTRKRLHPDSIGTKIPDSQVPNWLLYSQHILSTSSTVIHEPANNFTLCILNTNNRHTTHLAYIQHVYYWTWVGWWSQKGHLVNLCSLMKQCFYRSMPFLLPSQQVKALKAQILFLCIFKISRKSSLNICLVSGHGHYCRRQ